MARILVTDGEQRATLAVVRSLGRAGHTVFAAGEGKGFLSARSRHVSGILNPASALVAPQQFAEGIAGFMRQEAIEVLIPVAEGTLLALADHGEVLPRAAMPLPEVSTLHRILRKDVASTVAESIGLPVPEQAVIPSLSSPLPSGLQFPVVIKPSRSVVGTAGARSKVGVQYADDQDGLLRRLGDLPGEAYPILLQRRIVGPGIGLFFLIWEGRLLARFAHRRIREKPPSGGVSVLREAASVPERWFELGELLLRRLAWSGVAMVEVKEETATGQPYLMEINPRFWGSLQLAIDAGVDFPALLVSALLGTPQDPVLTYRTGLRTRWLLGDMDHLLLRLTRSSEALDLPADAPGRIQCVRDFVRDFRPSVRSEVFRFDDPRPGFHELVGWLRSL